MHPSTVLPLRTLAMQAVIHHQQDTVYLPEVLRNEVARWNVLPGTFAVVSAEHSVKRSDKKAVTPAQLEEGLKYKTIKLEDKIDISKIEGSVDLKVVRTSSAGQRTLFKGPAMEKYRVRQTKGLEVTSLQYFEDGMLEIDLNWRKIENVNARNNGRTTLGLVGDGGVLKMLTTSTRLCPGPLMEGQEGLQLVCEGSYRARRLE